jgi:transcriptional regulator with XRE-family HTH domain
MGTRLAKYIRNTGLTQLEFARQYGFPPPMVCQWMSGSRRPGLKNALRLAEITGGQVPAAYWTTLATKPPKRVVRDRASASPGREPLRVDRPRPRKFTVVKD